MNRVRQVAPPEVLLAVLRALGAPLDALRDVPAALRSGRWARARQCLEPVQVCSPGRPSACTVRVPASVKQLRCEWTLESGEIVRREIAIAAGGRTRGRTLRVAGESWVDLPLPGPARLPLGYHRLIVEAGNLRAQSLVLVAPERCYEPPATVKAWGLFTPLYALHSERSWGAGDYTDLAECMNWLRDCGGGLMATLPLLPSFVDHPCDPSPYSPVTRLFWNEFYLDVTRVPELTGCAPARALIQSAAFQRRLRSVQGHDLVRYREIMALKRQVLERLARHFFARRSARRAAFDRFVRQHPRVADYAGFRAAAEAQGVPWCRWPERQRRGELREGDFDPAIRDYHLYVQWLADEQLSQLIAGADGNGIQLYLDLPLGVHRDGYDTWRFQDIFALGASAGAPPDPVFGNGQNWGFPPVHPQRSRMSGHQYVIEYLRGHLARTGLLRIDHVMGLHRLYWIPEGHSATEGAYVTCPAHEFYAILALESHRHRAAVAGENLGTVPAEVNRAMRRHNVAELFVAQYEFRPGPRRPMRPVPRRAVASVNTHDMPTFQAYWDGADLKDRLDLGLIRRAALPRERQLRSRIRRALLRLLRVRRTAPHAASNELPRVTEVLPELLAYLGRTPAEFVLVTLEDLWGELLPQNTPGTSCERVNWQRKARLSLEQFQSDPTVKAVLDRVNRAR